MRTALVAETRVVGAAKKMPKRTRRRRAVGLVAIDDDGENENENEGGDG